jgi:sterol desaturase/sphingolipid hydroxylase (fatty acid hydroxylase superfamily)
MLQFFFREGWKLLREVAHAWDHPRTSEGTKTYVFDRALIDDYNGKYNDLRVELKKTVKSRGPFVQAVLIPFALLRIAMLAAAVLKGFALVLALSLLQFVIAPFSIFASIAAWINSIPLYFVVHFTSFALLQLLTSFFFRHVPVAAHYLRFPLTPTFIIGLFLLDQLACSIFCFLWTPIGRPTRFPFRQSMTSVVFGLFNVKLTWLIVLFCLRGTQVDLLALILRALIPERVFIGIANVFKPLLPPAALHSTYEGTLFYHYHRAVHLPGVYEQAHRLHHYLRETTPFEASSVDGSGTAEEWLRMMTEIGLSLATGLMPPSFSPAALKVALGNKIGHTRIADPQAIARNFHIHHHIQHVKNFGFFSQPLDLLTGTEYGDVSSNIGFSREHPLICEKKEDSEHYFLEVRDLRLQKVHDTHAAIEGAAAAAPKA